MNDTTIPTDHDTTELSPEWQVLDDLQNKLARQLLLHSNGRTVDLTDTLNKAQGVLEALRVETSTESEPIVSGEIDYWAHVEKRKATVGTSLAGLDDLLSGGLEAGKLYVLLGGPGGGKTTLANQLAVHVADSGRPVFYVTSEDVPFNLLAKTISRQGGIDYKAVLKGYKESSGLIEQTLSRYRESLAGSRLVYLDATLGTKLDTIRAQAGAHFEAYKKSDTCSNGGSGLLVIDYLQCLAHMLPSGPDGKQDLRQAVTKIVKALRVAASELDCAVLALASQHREATGGSYRANESVISSGKESGDIEYTGDVVMALAKDARDERRQTNPWLEPKILQVPKNRQGPVGEILLDWYGMRQQFTMAPDDCIVPVEKNGKKGGK